MIDTVRELAVPHETDVPLGPHTWYGVGGTAKVLARPQSIQQLSALAAAAHERKIPLYVLGSGANLLVRDAGVEGIVVKLDHEAFRQMTIDGTKVTAGAGYDLAKLVLETARAGLAGLHVLAGIPATVGGAVRMNAGGAFGDIGESVRAVHLMDGAGQAYTRDRDDLVFSYRHTNISARFILEVEFELSPDEPDDLVRRVKEVFLYKKNTQPLAADSAGCAFKNPPPEVGVSAGKLIDDAGLKGHRIGGAEVSERHANFIVASEGCKADDIYELIVHVQQEVLVKTGILLEREIAVWP